ALREHAAVNKKGIFDEALSTFFRNVDVRSKSTSYYETSEIPVGTGSEKIRNLRARAVLIDTEEGVVNEIMKGPLNEVFDHRQYVTDVSGAGNNWAVGHMFYGNKYKDSIRELIRKNAELCDSLESFFVMHSMGGGTGSGLGTAVLRTVADDYPEVHRFVVAVYPSIDDDVITSPYNCVLAMKQLTDFADCVMPLDNQSLVNIVNRIESVCVNTHTTGRTNSFTNSLRNRDPSKVVVDNNSTVISSANSTSASKKSEKPFDSINNIVANMLLNLTSSSRFEGSLNVDLNEIAMNLVPFPRMHYLLSSLSPLYISEKVNLQVRGIEQMFSDAFKRENQLLQCDPKSSLYLACALMLRGRVQISDMRRNIEKLKPQLNFIKWNQEGWKTGLCSVPAFGQPYSLLCLSNNTCIKDTFSTIKDRFNRLYKRKAHLHHYTQVEGMDLSLFAESLESLQNLINDYQGLENKNVSDDSAIERIKIMS
ncbi:tubulin epsilon chain, partial [Brachionus plicatilis]